MEKISVIIPVYNTEKYLKKCIQSVLDQTFQNFEILIVNDGSTDNSLVQCKNFELTDNRIRVLSQENRGQGFARNLALLKASGNFIFFLDSDDWLEKNILELLYSTAINSHSDVVISGWKRVDEIGNVLYARNDKKYIYNLNKESKISLLFSGQISMMCWGCLIKKDLIVNNFLFFPNLFHEDLYVMPKIYYYANKISYVDQELYNWLDREYSTVNSFSLKHALGLSGVFSAWGDFLLSENLYDKHKQDLFSGYMHYIALYKGQMNKCKELDQKEPIIECLKSLETKLYNEYSENYFELFEKYMIQNSNLYFSRNMNILYSYLEAMKKSNLQFALYGYGIIGHIVAEALMDQVIVIADQDSGVTSHKFTMCLPKDLSQYTFDRLIICVLGREDLILETLDISQDKIITIDIRLMCDGIS